MDMNFHQIKVCLDELWIWSVCLTASASFNSIAMFCIDAKAAFVTKDVYVIKKFQFNSIALL